MDETTPSGDLSTPGAASGAGEAAASGPGGEQPAEAGEWEGADTIGSLPDDESPESSRSAAARDTLAQLQAMIDTIATHATPVARQIGAKAAELAAVAAERAGPLARRAADVTEEAGIRLAERSRALAEELRREAGTNGTGTPGASDERGPGGPSDAPGS